MGEHDRPGHDHPPHLAHHFDTPEQQFESGKLGMWLFLSTEILLFGGLFCAYAVYRANHPEIFIYAHQFLDKILGGINTVVLLCSSLTMAWAVRAAQLGQQRALRVLLALTLLGGLGFMGIKAVEYEHKWKHGLLWGTRYDAEKTAHSAGEAGHDSEASEAVPQTALDAGPAVDPAGSTTGEDPALDPSPAGTTLPPAGEAPRGTVLAGGGEEPEHAAERGEHGVVPENVQIFFGIYFLMTGLHGLHVLLGMGAIGYLLFKAFGGGYGPSYFTPVDMVGLYWHLVDLIWIFLFPLLYLIH